MVSFHAATILGVTALLSPETENTREEQEKMDLTKLMQDKEIQIVVMTNFEFDSFVKGHHEYKNIWTPKIGETLLTEREPGNLVDKYVVCVKKNNEIVEHLQLGKDGKFAETVFYFLRADEYGSCDVLIKGKPVNLGDDDEMQVPCSLNFTGRKKFIDILEKT